MIYISIIAGVLSICVWITVMYAFSWRGVKHGDVIASVGSDFTQVPKNYFKNGIIACCVTGAVLSPIYYFLLEWFDFTNIIIDIGLSGFFGLSQGFLFMHFFVEGTALSHPNRVLQRFFIPVSFAYWLGHFCFGVSLGAVISAFFNYGWQGLAIASSLILAALITINLLVLRDKRRDLRSEGPIIHH